MARGLRADLVNPEALATPDPDYVLLKQGSGPVTGGVLGTLAGDTLPAGGYLLRVSATDLNGATAYLGFVIGVRVDPLDIRPNIVITTPTNDSTITFVTNIMGSVTTRQELREWYVEYAPLSQVNLQNLADNSASWKRIASGTDAVTNVVLAAFDATLVPNDAYVIRVSAWNRNGLGWTESATVNVSGNAKPGAFAVQYTDVELPLAGIPVSVKRSYNSLNAARAGDFGYGWSLAVQNADIAETIPQTGTGFGSTPLKVGTRVYLTAPDGKRIGFTFQPEVGASSFLGTSYKAVFKPDPGITYTLSVPEGDSAFLSLDSLGNAALFFIALPWNPDTYILKDKLSTSYTYDQSSGLIEIADANGNRVTFSDNAIKHSAGPQVKLTRDATHRITQITAPDGSTWLYQYNAAGDLVQVTYPGNLIATFGYSTSRPHFLETINDPTHGPSERTEYDANGRVTAIIDANGNRHEQHWDPSAFSGTLTDARGNVTQLFYNDRGNLTRRVDPLGGVTLWEYKDSANPDRETAMTDPRGNKTKHQYDARGNLLREDTPLTYTIYTYDDQNRVTKKQYRTGGAEQFDYDAQGNLVHYTASAGAEWNATYTANGLPASVTDGEGGLTRLEYDNALGIPTGVIAPDGGTLQLQYDEQGRLTQFTDALGAITRLEYDTTGRITRTIYPNGGVKSTAYDSAFPDLPSRVTNRVGQVTYYTYDALGRLTALQTPGGATTHYEYDADGNRTAVVDPVNNRYEFKYDAMSRLVEDTDPLGKRRTYVYDLAGNRTNAVDRLNRKRSFVYDANNRVTQERWHDPVNDAVLRTITYGYDSAGQMNSASDPDAAISLGWPIVPGGALQTESATYTGQAPRRILRKFDKAGRLGDLTAIKSGSVLTLHYERDSAGRLSILKPDGIGLAGVPDNFWRLEFGRNARGDVTELRRFADVNGTQPVSSTTITRSDSCGCWIDGIAHVVATNLPLANATLSFVRDLDGAITGMQEGTDSLVVAYDAAAQLAGVTRNAAPSENYSYDASGNRTASHRHATYVTGLANRLLQAGPWSLSYDDEGNLVTKSNTSSGLVFAFTWDYRNRLTSVERDDRGPPVASDVTQYRYDALDRRIAIIKDSQTNWIYYDQMQPLMEYVNADDNPSALYFNGDDVDQLKAVWRQGEGVFWPLLDQLGSVRRVLDHTGTEVAALTSDRYGNLLSATGTKPDAAGRFAFAGREWDADTGLYYNRARYYDPDLGRFIGEDPIGFSSGDANLYRYALNQPLTRIDPFGTTSALEYALLAGSALTYGLGSQTLFLAGEVNAICSNGQGPVGAFASGATSGAVGAIAGGAQIAGGAAGGGPLGAAGAAIAFGFEALGEALKALAACVP